MINDTDLARLIRSLSLRQKAALCSGLDFWTTKPIPSKGIPSLRTADGPHGLRYEDKVNHKRNGAPSRRATCFPPEVALACSFSPALARRVGAAIADECRAQQVGVLLGPGVNIKRSPLGGRNFEYYSEDPLLTGEMAAGFIQGVQSRGVGTCLKHFAVNNQESYRMSISAAVDDRALFDIYLRAFEIAIQKANPASIMASYNKLDGIYATENRRLLTEILRMRLGYTGAVVSDWSSVADRPAAVAAGMDLEMPASGSVNDLAIEQAVLGGTLSEDALDTACWNVLRLVFGWHQPEGLDLPSLPPRTVDENAPKNEETGVIKNSATSPKETTVDYTAHHALAVEALAKSAVLLKNDGMLPLCENETGRLAVIGEMAHKPHFQGGGSSVINPKNLISFTDALRAAGIPFTYARGYKGLWLHNRLFAEAVAAAREADTVLLFLGLPDVYECEGYDRTTLCLPENQLRLLYAVAEANPNVCVVLSTGAPVEAPWLSAIRSLLCLHLGGEGFGKAALQLLYGHANPGGKLAESWPLALADNPSHHHFPMGPNEVRYSESIYVGYRYYDTANRPVLFPFGYGLSYTNYAYSALTLHTPALATGESVQLSFTLANEGAVDGEEIVQVYAARTASALHRPTRELVAFERVSVLAGQSVPVQLDIPYDAFAVYDTTRQKRVVEAGPAILLVGPHSRELPLQATLSLVGETLSPAHAESAGGPYGRIEDNCFPDDAFAGLYGYPPAENVSPQKGSFGWDTPLGLMRKGPWGWGLFLFAALISLFVVHFSHERRANWHAAIQLAKDMPFKNVVITTSGIIPPGAARELLALCNGKPNPLPFFGQFFKRRPYKSHAKYLDE